MARTWARGTQGTWLLAVLSCALAPAAVRAQECSDDADCPSGYECDLPPSAGAAEPCTPGMSCDRAPAPDPEPPRGECEPAELRCKTDSDCPSGAVCTLRRADCDSSSPDSAGSDSDASSDAAPVPTAGQGGSAGSGGGATPEPETPVEECEPPSDGECVFTLTECKSNSDCDGGDVCTEFGREERCSQAPSCAGNGCPEQPEPEPMCESRTLSYCFPKPVDCSDGEACSGDRRCVSLPEDLEDEAPPSWNGATALCLPEVWALAFEERIEIEGGGGSSESASDRASTSGGAKSASDDNGTAQGDSAAEDDGCAVSNPGTGRARGAWLLLGVAALLLSQRRRTRRDRA